MNSIRHLVLVIDDDPWIAQSTAMILQAEGFDVVTAKDGEDGIQLARQRRPSVILLDIMMPGLSGWETLECLKTDGVTADIPVVVFSARDIDRGVATARGRGAQSFVSKPFEPLELVRLVKKHVSEIATPKSA